MSVQDNLATSRCAIRGHDAAYVEAAFRAIAQNDRDGMTDVAAQGPRAHSRQPSRRSALGRGMVREDVNALLFDEPLTVIDPHMKWELRTHS